MLSPDLIYGLKMLAFGLVLCAVLVWVGGCRMNP
jgi:hypothetical protein